MYSINGTNISLTRGDTFKCVLSLTEDSKTYIPDPEDRIRFALKRNYKSEEILIRKEIPNNSLLFKLNPEDTKNLEYGEYVYDMEITKQNGDVDTFLKGKLKLTEAID